MCLFNEHMADKHWYVLQRNAEKEAKVEYKKGFLFIILFLLMFILFILGNLECQLNTNCQFHIYFPLIGDELKNAP